MDIALYLSLSLSLSLSRYFFSFSTNFGNFVEIVKLLAFEQKKQKNMADVVSITIFIGGVVVVVFKFLFANS